MACAASSRSPRRAWPGCGPTARSSEAAATPIERHLPPTLRARDPARAALLPDAVVKHVNGREGDSVVFGDTLDARGWEARLLEGGYVVQRAVIACRSRTSKSTTHACATSAPRYACVGGLLDRRPVRRLLYPARRSDHDGQATYAATLREP